MAEKKSIVEVFADAGFDPNKPILFGRIELNKKMQNALKSLAAYPKEKVINFIESEVNRRKEAEIEYRRNEREYAEKNSERISEDAQVYYFELEKEYIKEYEEGAIRSIDRAVAWYENNVVSPGHELYT